MFSGERRKESHHASKIEAAHIKAPAVPFHLQTGNAGYVFLVLVCFTLFSYHNGWGEMEETYCSQQAREAARMFSRVNGCPCPRRVGTLTLVMVLFLGSAYLGVTRGPIQGAAREVRYLWKSALQFPLFWIVDKTVMHLKVTFHQQSLHSSGL